MKISIYPPSGMHSSPYNTFMRIGERVAAERALYWIIASDDLTSTLRTNTISAFDDS